MPNSKITILTNNIQLSAQGRMSIFKHTANQLTHNKMRITTLAPDMQNTPVSLVRGEYALTMPGSQNS